MSSDPAASALEHDSTPPLAAALDSRVELMTYHGGIIGAFMNDRKKLQAEILRWNQAGYRLRHVLPGKAGLGPALMQLICLVITFMLWCPVPGETLIFERQL